MTVQCVTCESFSLRRAGKIARYGFGHCIHDIPARSKSADYPRICSKHVAVDMETEKKRIAWITKK